MQPLVRWLVLIGFLLTGIFIYLWNESRKRITRTRVARMLEEKQLLEEENQHLQNTILPLIENIKKCVSQFKNYMSAEKGYFRHYEATTWKNDFKELHSKITSLRFSDIGLDNQYVDLINTFLIYFNKCESLRKEYNQRFIESELNIYTAFFNDIEGRCLDLQQRRAIVTDENNNIIIAGAGSGKTTTIVGKVNYIIDKYNVNPEEVLLISFTRKSASELGARLKSSGITAKTFHRFGLEVIAEVEKVKPSLFDESQFMPFLIKTFSDLIRDTSYLKKVTDYFTEFLKPQKEQEEFDNQGKYFEYLKSKDFRTYKNVLDNRHATYNREVVKSIEECRIANYLYFNRIKYEYEKPYPYQTATENYRQYKPDFTIEQDEEHVYIEHFGLSKNGKVPPFFADISSGETHDEATTKYKEGIAWKRNLHETNHTKLIETYSHQMMDDELFDKLELSLKKVGIRFDPMTPQEVWRIIAGAAKEEVDSFITLFGTFITLMKSNNYDISDVISFNKNEKHEYQRKRNKLFIDLISPVFIRYQQKLAERNEIDFSDMINKATNYIRECKFKKKISYVIVDEFQDISIGRYQLLKALKDQNPNSRLFCVGDDWQSIYRFAGSDLALFRNFEKYFGYTESSKIETTYRFHEPLISLTGNFILKNKNQKSKTLKSANVEKTTTHKIVYSYSDNLDITNDLRLIFDEIIARGKHLDKKIVLLGRYSFDLKKIKNDERIFTIENDQTIIYRWTDGFGKTNLVSAEFLTVHKAKGLEADIVVILNCNSGKQGFPSEMSDDQVLNLLLSESDQFENGEERRLFYVAMTRAKEMVYLIADSVHKSKFITELEAEDSNRSIPKCRKCVTADLVKRTGNKNGKQWSFYGCSNYIYGCDYKEWR